MSVGFYICTIGPQIDILKLKRLCYNFCPTSVIRLLDYCGIWTRLGDCNYKIVTIVQSVYLQVKPWSNGLASSRKLKTWVYLRLRLARPCVHLRWLGITLVEMKFARKSRQFFYCLATQRKSFHKFNLPLLATTCESVWPGLNVFLVVGIQEALYCVSGDRRSQPESGAFNGNDITNELQHWLNKDK